MGLFRKSGTSKQKNITASVYVINHPVLGEVTVSRNPRARRISVSVRPPGRVRLAYPTSISQEKAIRFLDSKQEWVFRALERVKAKSAATTVISTHYRTKRHILELTTGANGRIAIRIGGGKITIEHPESLSHVDEPVQSAIKKGIEEAWRIEAKDILPERIRQLADRHGFRYGSVSVRNTVSKWGSCSVRNDISLSLHLMRLPDHLIDYIILHELCHTVHKNHGPSFHALLDKHTEGRHYALRKELRKYNTRW